MSQANVEIVKAAIDAVNREDWDAAFQDAAPGFELDMSRGLGLMRASTDLIRSGRSSLNSPQHWEAVWIEAHEFIDAGDLLVVPQTTHGRGVTGSRWCLAPPSVWTIRDGTIERVSMYQERQDALEAVGLSEQDAHTEPWR